MGYCQVTIKKKKNIDQENIVSPEYIGIKQQTCKPYVEQEAGRNERETDKTIIIMGSISILLSIDWITRHIMVNSSLNNTSWLQFSE